MHTPLRDYEQHARDRCHLRISTLQERMREIARFLDFLGSRNVMNLDQMRPDDIGAFITSSVDRSEPAANVDLVRV